MLRKVPRVCAVSACEHVLRLRAEPLVPKEDGTAGHYRHDAAHDDYTELPLNKTKKKNGELPHRNMFSTISSNEGGGQKEVDVGDDIKSRTCDEQSLDSSLSGPGVTGLEIIVSK